MQDTASIIENGGVKWLGQWRKSSSPGLFLSGIMTGFLAAAVTMILTAFLAYLPIHTFQAQAMMVLLCGGLGLAFIWSWRHGFGVLLGGSMFFLFFFLPHSDQYEPDQIRYRLGIGPGDQELIRKFDEWRIRLPREAKKIKYRSCNSFLDRRHTIFFELDASTVRELERQSQFYPISPREKQHMGNPCWLHEWGPKPVIEMGLDPVFPNNASDIWFDHFDAWVDLHSDGSARGVVYVATY